MDSAVVYFLDEGKGTSVNFLSPKKAWDSFLVISYIKCIINDVIYR